MTLRVDDNLAVTVSIETLRQDPTGKCSAAPAGSPVDAPDSSETRRLIVRESRNPPPLLLLHLAHFTTPARRASSAAISSSSAAMISFIAPLAIPRSL